MKSLPSRSFPLRASLAPFDADSIFMSYLSYFPSYFKKWYDKDMQLENTLSP